MNLPRTQVIFSPAGESAPPIRVKKEQSRDSILALSFRGEVNVLEMSLQRYARADVSYALSVIMYKIFSDFEMQTPIMAITAEHQSAVELRHSSDNCKEATVRDAQVPHVLKTSDCAFIDSSTSKTIGSIQVDDSQSMGAGHMEAFCGTANQ